MTTETEVQSLKLPENINLPVFVYGLLKPGMPAFEMLRTFVEGEPKKDTAKGELYVRDGLPLLFLNNVANVDGYVLSWKSGQQKKAYQLICEFEPDKHYMWEGVGTTSGIRVNLLKVRFRSKGNPQPLISKSWNITDDPAFGEGLKTVRASLVDLKNNIGSSGIGKLVSFACLA